MRQILQVQVSVHACDDHEAKRQQQFNELCIKLSHEKLTLLVLLIRLTPIPSLELSRGYH